MSLELEAFLDLPIHDQILNDEPSAPPAAYKPTNPRLKYCPCCNPQKELEILEKEERLGCDNCGWVYYDNPLMVSTALMVLPERFIGETNVHAPFDFRAGDFFEIGPKGGLRLKPTGVVIIERASLPFVGGKALPGGFTNWRETPRRGSFREASEEVSLLTRIRADAVVCACNPDPRFLNQATITQLAIPVDGVLQAGSDASGVQIYGETDMPNLCFSSHNRTVERWFKGRYAHLLKSFFMDPDAAVDEI